MTAVLSWNLLVLSASNAAAGNIPGEERRCESGLHRQCMSAPAGQPVPQQYRPARQGQGRQGGEQAEFSSLFPLSVFLQCFTVEPFTVL